MVFDVDAMMVSQFMKGQESRSDPTIGMLDNDCWPCVLDVLESHTGPRDDRNEVREGRGCKMERARGRRGGCERRS